MSQVDHSIQPIAITVAEAAKLLSLGRTTIWKLIKEGKLQTFHVGKSCRILMPSLLSLVRPTDPATAVEVRRRGRPRKVLPNALFQA